MKLGNSPKSIRPLGKVAAATLLSFCAFGLAGERFSSAYAGEASSKERSLTDFELTNNQRSLFIGAAKSLAELGLEKEVFHLLEILKRTDVKGRYAKFNYKLEKQLKSKLTKSLNSELSDSSRKAKVKRAKSILKRISKNLVKGIEEFDISKQKKILKILSKIDSKSSEYLSLSRLIKGEGAWTPDLILDVNSIPASIGRVNSLSLGTNIDSGVTSRRLAFFDPTKAVNYATYTDSNRKEVSIQSTVLDQEDLSLLLHESLRAAVLLEGLGSQNWNSPTVEQLLLVMLDSGEVKSLSEQSNPDLVLSVNTISGDTEKLNVKFFTIDSSNRHSLRLQVNMLITDLVERALKNKRYENLPGFIKIGIKDLVSREITQLNAGAVDEIKKAIRPRDGRGVDFRETKDFRALMFSGPTDNINSEELRAVGSSDFSLLRLFNSESLAGGGLGRLAAVRYVQYLYERKYLREFVSRIEEKKPGSVQEGIEVLTSVTGKGIEKIETDFKSWVKQINERDQAGDDSSFGNRGIVQSLDDYVKASSRTNEARVLEDVTEGFREASEYLKTVRKSYFGYELPLDVSPLLCEGARLHAYYMIKMGEDGFEHYQDFSSDLSTLLGALSAENSELSLGSEGVKETMFMSLKSLMGTVYHRLDILSRMFSLAGAYNIDSRSNALNIPRDNSVRLPASVLEKTLCFPCDGSVVPRKFCAGYGSEQPDPAPGIKGYPITAVFRGPIPKNVKIQLFAVDSKGKAKEVNCTFLTPKTDPHGRLKAYNAIAAVPDRALDGGAEHFFRITGDNFETMKARFTTEPK